VQSTSRSTLKGSAASGIFQQAGFAKLLRLVFDTAALRGSARMRPLLACLFAIKLTIGIWPAGLIYKPSAFCLGG
jgi:hypothetical protein